nr:MAG TPA: hypothetical protein [Bacteriophage sp.]DAS89721.1 MAG TPA: hypothetical protein [Caudoviricetes sp.]
MAYLLLSWPFWHHQGTRKKVLEKVLKEGLNV